MFGRVIDKALRASEQRHATLLKELAADRNRFEEELAADRKRFEVELAADRKAFEVEQKAERRRFEAEMEQRYRDEVQITREFMRRNELVTTRLVEKIEQLTEDSRAQTRAILQVLDRLQNGGGTATAG